MPKMRLPSKLKGFATEKARHKVALGGRGSGKSMSVADLCLMDCQVKGIKTACFREFQTSIDDSVHSLLCEEIDRLELQGFTKLHNSIQYNGEDAFKYRGMARNVEGIKSMHGFGRAFIEEAQSSSSKSIKTLTPTFRTEDSELWWVANPRSAADPFSQRFIVPYLKQLRRDGYYKDEQHLIVMCNWRDNPMFPDVLKKERLYDKEHLSDALYRHIWEGEFYDEVENTIIPVDWFDAAIDAHIKLGIRPNGKRVVAHDPSDEGPDDKAVCLRHGSVIEDVQTMDTGDINDGCDWALEYCDRVNADHFVWDADGMGISLKREVSTVLGGRRVTYEPFHGASSVDDPEAIYKPAEDEGRPENELSRRRLKKNREVFKNRRSQYWWKLRDRFCRTYEAVSKGKYIDPDTLIFLSSNITDMDNLRAEICRIPRKPNPSGLIQIMSKDDMAKLPEPIPSPNMGDACMMSMTTPQEQVTVKLRNSSPWGR